MSDHTPNQTKALTEIDPLETTGGEIDPPSWNSTNPSPDQLAAEGFLAWWAHYIQSLGLDNGQQAV